MAKRRPQQGSACKHGADTGHHLNLHIVGGVLQFHLPHQRGHAVHARVAAANHGNRLPKPSHIEGCHGALALLFHARAAGLLLPY